LDPVGYIVYEEQLFQAQIQKPLSNMRTHGSLKTKFFLEQMDGAIRTYSMHSINKSPVMI
jgi:hypothetical protein